MLTLFEVVDPSGRTIHLSKKRWNEHIRRDHPEVEDLEAVKGAIVRPTKTTHPFEGKVYHYKYFKHRHGPDKYLMVVVKYLNGSGFVITAHYTTHIK